MNHIWVKCVEETKHYARKVRGNDVNPELLIHCFLEQTCGPVEWRDELFKIAMEEYHGESYVD